MKMKIKPGGRRVPLELAGGGSPFALPQDALCRKFAAPSALPSQATPPQGAFRLRKPRLLRKPFSTYSLEAHADKVVIAGERPRLPVAWSDDVKELLTCTWRDAVWKSTSAVTLTGTTSRRWRGASELISTQARRPSTTLLRGPRRWRSDAPRGLGRTRPASGQYGVLRHRVSRVTHSDGRHGRGFQKFLVVPFPLPYRQIKCTPNY